MARRRLHWRGWASALAAGFAATSAAAQEPPPLAAEQPPAPARRPGVFRRLFHHGEHGQRLRDKFIGRPEEFVVPPLGYDVNAGFNLMKAGADQHGFTLYRSDFLTGTNTLSPAGAERLTRIARGLPGWLGPLVVEWTPDKPGLAESRRAAVVALLGGAGLPVPSERVLVGPVTDNGVFGTEAGNNHQSLMTRSQQAPAAYTLTPRITTTFGGS